MLASDDPTARVDDDRRQRALVRIDPDRVARTILADQHRGPARPPLAGSHRFPPGVVLWRVGRQHPGRDTPIGGGDASIRSGRTLRRHEPRSTLQCKDTGPPGVRYRPPAVDPRPRSIEQQRSLRGAGGQLFGELGELAGAVAAATGAHGQAAAVDKRLGADAVPLDLERPAVLAGGAAAALSSIGATNRGTRSPRCTSRHSRSTLTASATTTGRGLSRHLQGSSSAGTTSGPAVLVAAVANAAAAPTRGLGAAHREASARACAQVPNRSVTVPGVGQSRSWRRASASGPRRRAWVRDQS